MKYRYVLVLLLVLLLFWCMCNKPLPEGTFIKSSVSPSGLYQINVYLCDGGATVDQAIRAEVVIRNTGNARNIYWQYHAHDADIEWLSDELVIVNDVTLNVLNDMYDYRSK